MLLSFYHTCSSKQHHDLHDRESPMLSLSYTSGNFSLQNLACIFAMMGFLKMPQVFVSKQVGCTPTQFLLLSFHIFIALVHPLHGNPYSLTLITIDGHLHSPLIRLVDVRLSLFLSSPQPPPSTTIVLCPWLALMYCVKVEKKLKRVKKYEPIARLVIGVVHDGSILCNENQAWPNYMILQG